MVIMLINKAKKAGLTRLFEKKIAETFIRFHERNSRILVPSGEKHVGSAENINEKKGCIIMVTMD